jgi:hypothetical protein
MCQLLRFVSRFALNFVPCRATSVSLLLPGTCFRPPHQQDDVLKAVTIEFHRWCKRQGIPISARDVEFGKTSLRVHGACACVAVSLRILNFPLRAPCSVLQRGFNSFVFRASGWSVPRRRPLSTRQFRRNLGSLAPPNQPPPNAVRVFAVWDLPLKVHLISSSLGVFFQAIVYFQTDALLHGAHCSGIS